MKNIVFGVGTGDPHDRRGKLSVCAFMYGRPSSPCTVPVHWTSHLMFEKKLRFRDEGFFVRLKAPIGTVHSFFESNTSMAFQEYAEEISLQRSEK